MAFDRAFEKVVMLEGGYVNDPYDRGGETKYGITEEVARDYGYEGKMKYLSLSTAEDIYRENYWKQNKLNQFKHKDVACKVFDIAVNMGNRAAIRLLQKAYNKLNKKNIVVDGLIGNETLTAVNSYDHSRNLIQALSILQGERYFKIVENDNSQIRFIRGWLNRIFKFLEEF